MWDCEYSDINMLIISRININFTGIINTNYVLVRVLKDGSSARVPAFFS